MEPLRNVDITTVLTEVCESRRAVASLHHCDGKDSLRCFCERVLMSRQPQQHNEKFVFLIGGHLQCGLQ